MVTIEQWSQTVTKNFQVIKGLVNGKFFVTPHIILNAPGKEIICQDGTRYKLGVRATNEIVQKSKRKPSKKISDHPTLF